MLNQGERLFKYEAISLITYKHYTFNTIFRLKCVCDEEDEVETIEDEEKKKKKQ